MLAIPSLGGDSLEDFSVRVTERWKIGREGFDNGVILVIARDDRKVRIEVGYGLEGRLTDLTAGRIIRDRIVPEFRAGRVDQGVLNGVVRSDSGRRGELPGPCPASDRARGIRRVKPGAVRLRFHFSGVHVGPREPRPLGTAAGGLFMPFLGHMAFAPGPLMLLGLGGIGLVAAMCWRRLPAPPRPWGRALPAAAGTAGSRSTFRAGAEGFPRAEEASRAEAAGLAEAALPGVGDAYE